MDGNQSRLCIRNELKEMAKTRVIRKGSKNILSYQMHYNIKRKPMLISETSYSQSRRQGAGEGEMGRNEGMNKMITSTVSSLHSKSRE